MRTLLHTVATFQVVGYSINGTNIYNEVIANKTDIILVLNINMPKDGIEVIKEFSKKGFPCKVIILSSYDDVKIIKE
jgi:YesN/AraC family two-component response regulator